MDTVDQHFTHEWLDNVANVLDGRKPDYLVVQHMEPDHAANIQNFVNTYPDTVVVATEKAFAMMANFFDMDLSLIHIYFLPAGGPVPGDGGAGEVRRQHEGGAGGIWHLLLLYRRFLLRQRGGH